MIAAPSKLSTASPTRSSSGGIPQSRRTVLPDSGRVSFVTVLPDNLANKRKKDTAYCVGVSTVSTSTTTSSTPSQTSMGPIPAPTPNQPGNAIASCNRYAATQAGDWCQLFADRHAISLANLYAWNSV